MNPIVKGTMVALGAGGVVLGIKELVSPTSHEEVRSSQTTGRGLSRQADIVGISDEAIAQVVVPEDLDKHTFRVGFVDPLKAAMKGGNCEARTAAFTQFMGAAAQLSKVGAEIESYFGPDDNKLVNQYVPAMRDRCTKEAYNECVEKHDFSRLLLLGSNRARERELMQGNEADPLYDELLDKCLSFELEFESLTLLPPMNAEIRAKSLVRLSRDEEADQQSAYTLSGEAPLTGSAQARVEGCRLEGPTPTKPFHAQRVAIFSDTTGWGALRKESQRIADALQALKAEEKAAEEAKEKEGKAPSASDVARRDNLRKALAVDQKALNAQEAKRAGKDLNRPLKIELDYLPGTLSLFLRCPEVGPLQIGGYYAEWPKHPIFAPYLPEKIPLVFQRNDIQGGELFARRTIREEAEGATVSLTFTLWHRPEKAALAIN